MISSTFPTGVVVLHPALRVSRGRSGVMSLRFLLSTITVALMVGGILETDTSSAAWASVTYASISCGETICGDISGPLEVDSYRFPGTAGGSIILRLHASGSVLPLVEIYDPSGGRVFQRFGSSDVRIDLELLTSGEYTILVMDYGGTGVWPYCLRLPRGLGPGGG